VNPWFSILWQQISSPGALYAVGFLPGLFLARTHTPLLKTHSKATAHLNGILSTPGLKEGLVFITRGLSLKIFAFIDYVYLPVQIDEMTTSQKKKLEIKLNKMVKDSKSLNIF